jgi:hypothetical protein
MLWALPLATFPLLLRFKRRPALLPEIPFSATWLIEQALAADQQLQRLTELLLPVIRVEPGPYFHSALSHFDDPAHGDLRQVNARQWWKLEPTGRTIVHARFTNGDPFLIENPDTRAIGCRSPDRSPDRPVTFLPSRCPAHCARLGSHRQHATPSSERDPEHSRHAPDRNNRLHHRTR